MVSGSDRACEKWLADYDLPGIGGLALHHLYRAMDWLGEELPADQQAGATPFAPRTVKDLVRSEEHTSELQSRQYLVGRLLLEKKETLPTERTFNRGSPSYVCVLSPTCAASANERSSLSWSAVNALVGHR